MARIRRLRVAVPKTRDPFINTPLIRAGFAADGAERFWISTWNSCVGTLALLITEHGDARRYDFGGARHAGFYSAVAEDNDTLWLCGNLSRVVRLDLRTGAFAEFATGAPDALMFQGMVLDPASGKLFAAAFPYTSTTAFSFDFRARLSVKVYDQLGPDKYMRFSFPNGDGTWSAVLHIPGETLLRWDPLAETVEPFQFNPELDSEDCSAGTSYFLVDDAAGRRYLPGRGWYDPRTRTISPATLPPQREMTWFARRGTQAWGCVYENGNARVGLWDMATGKVRDLCTIPDSHVQSLNLTASGKLVAVNTYGEFFRFDAPTGALEMSRRLDADACGAVDCLCRINRDRLLGTPFITQRFWEVNLKTGKGADCGRAAPGAGEILQTWKLGGKVYMAAYTGGELMEYDPALPARFPENPRIVADPPGGMRPVAAADNGQQLFYSCSRTYGRLGSVLTRYDTQTGAASYGPDPLPDQQICSLGFDVTTLSLLCGSTMHADCHSATATSDQCWFAQLNPDNFQVQAKVAAPAGTSRANVLGPVAPGQWLCSCNGFADGSPWLLLDTRELRMPTLRVCARLSKDIGRLLYAGTPGYFVVQVGRRIELWHWPEAKRVDILCRNFTGYRIEVDADSVYLIKPREITILDGCLRGLP